MRTNTAHHEGEANGIKHRCTQTKVRTEYIGNSFRVGPNRAACQACHSPSWPSAAIHASPSGRRAELRQLVHQYSRPNNTGKTSRRRATEALKARPDISPGWRFTRSQDRWIGGPGNAHQPPPARNQPTRRLV